MLKALNGIDEKYLHNSYEVQLNGGSKAHTMIVNRQSPLGIMAFYDYYDRLKLCSLAYTKIMFYNLFHKFYIVEYAICEVIPLIYTSNR